jgi:hypothetical protein
LGSGNLPTYTWRTKLNISDHHISVTFNNKHSISSCWGEADLCYTGGGDLLQAMNIHQHVYYPSLDLASGLFYVFKLNRKLRKQLPGSSYIGDRDTRSHKKYTWLPEE